MGSITVIAVDVGHGMRTRLGLMMTTFDEI
jgi:hypothetical protein